MFYTHSPPAWSNMFFIYRTQNRNKCRCLTLLLMLNIRFDCFLKDIFFFCCFITSHWNCFLDVELQACQNCVSIGVWTWTKSKTKYGPNFTANHRLLAAWLAFPHLDQTDTISWGYARHHLVTFPPDWLAFHFVSLFYNSHGSTGHYMERVA